MTEIESLIGKLSLLGDKVTVLTEDSFIAQKNNGDHITCYNVGKNGILSKNYTSIIVGDKSPKPQYIIGINDNENHVLDRHLVITARFPFENLLTFDNDDYILCNKYVVTMGKNSNALRLCTVNGEEITEGIVSWLKIWGIPKSETDNSYKKIIVRYIQSNGNSEVKIIDEHFNQRKLLIKLTTHDHIAVGYNSYAIEYDEQNKIIQYGYDDKIKLVIKHGSMQNMLSSRKPYCVIKNSFGHEITRFDIADVLY